MRVRLKETPYPVVELHPVVELQKQGLVNLDIGSGKPGWQRIPLDEWIHLDIISHPHVEMVTDFANIPLSDGDCDEIWLGDVIEHVPVWRRDEIFREWNRILKIGGKVGGQTPNPDRIIRDFMDKTMTYHDMIWGLYGQGTSQWEVHYLTYDKSMLIELFDKYGFDVKDFSESPGPSSRPWWYRFHGTKVRNL
jgi:predicted SAM-dependent methyltransferase